MSGFVSLERGSGFIKESAAPTLAMFILLQFGFFMRLLLLEEASHTPIIRDVAHAHGGRRRRSRAVTIGSTRSKHLQFSVPPPYLISVTELPHPDPIFYIYIYTITGLLAITLAGILYFVVVDVMDSGGNTRAKDVVIVI